MQIAACGFWEVGLKRIVGIILVALVVGFVAVYAGDWMIWKVRVARGGGMGTVQVRWFQVAELNGGKEEMYPDGQGPVACSESLFPQGGSNPCWYVAKNPVVLERPSSFWH
jgi:hypothetical protein